MQNTTYIKFGQAAFIGSALIYLGVFLLSIINNGVLIQHPIVYLLQMVTSILLCVFFFNFFSKTSEYALSSVRLCLISSSLLLISNLGLFLGEIFTLSLVTNLFLILCSLSYILLTLSVFLVVYKFKNLYSGLTILSAITTLFFSQLMFCLLLNNILNLNVYIDLTYISILCIAGFISSIMLLSTFSKATKYLAQ